METIAWIVLRVAIAWMFLYPLKDLLKDWSAAKGAAALLFPKFPQLAAIMMVLMMFTGGLSILLGFYSQIFAIGLCVYCIMGYVAHNRFAKLITTTAEGLNQNDPAVKTVVTLGVVGQTTSAWKNIVLAAISFFIMLVGTGSWSLTGAVW